MEIVFDSILPTIHVEDKIFWRPLKQEILKFTHIRMHFWVLEALFSFEDHLECHGAMKGCLLHMDGSIGQAFNSR